MHSRKNGKGRQQLPLLAAAFLLSLTIAGAYAPKSAKADCSAPLGVAGQQMYNSSESVMQYCDGGDWIPMWGSASAASTVGELPDPVECTITSGQMTLLDSLGTGSNPNAVFVQNNVLYLGYYGATGVRTVDVSDPSNMSTLDSVDLGEITPAVTISLDGNYAYNVNGSQDGFRIVSISNPSNISQTGAMGAAVGDNAWGIVRHPSNANYIYTTSYDDDEVDVVNVSNPASPSRAGGYGPDATNINGASGIDISGNTLFVTGEISDSLATLDITDPANPAFLDSVSSGTQLDNPRGVAVSGDYAFVAASNSDAVTAIDISNPSDISIVGSLTGADIDTPYNVKVAGHYAFVTMAGTGGVVAIDISDPTNMSVVDVIGDSIGGGGDTNLYIDGNVLYTPNTSNNTLYAIDLGCDFGSGNTNLGDLMYEAECPAGYTYNPSLAGCYEVHTTAVNYATAQGICSAGGGNLIKTDSRTEQLWAYNSVGNARSWIGLNDIASEGTFVWENGDAYIRTDWDSGEPNNSGNEDCTMLKENDTWVDWPCSGTFPYVCEADPIFADITCPAGYKFHPRAMKCLSKVSASTASWPAAQAACEADGGRLPHIFSAEKNAIIDQFSDNKLYIWIGLSDAATEGEWLWSNGVDGGPNNFEDWAPSEPSGNADYAVNGYNYAWDDTPSTYHYICEAPPEELCYPEVHNARSVKNNSSITSTFSNYEVPDVTDGILMVSVGVETASVNNPIVSVTYDGTPMTLAGADSRDNGSYYNNGALYYLTGLTAGTGDIVVTFTNTPGSNIISASVVSCLEQQAPEAFATTNAAPGSGVHTTPITTLTDGAVLVDSITINEDTGPALTTENGQIEVQSNFNSGTADVAHGMSARVTDYAGNYNMSWSFTNSDRIAHVVASFASTMLGGSGGDNMGNHIATENLDMGGYRVINTVDPTNPGDAVTKAYVDARTDANETDPQVGDISTAGRYCQSDGSVVNCDVDTSATLGPLLKTATVAESQPGGTYPTTAVTGSWQTLTLNSIQGDSIGITLASNEVTLPAGTYYVEANIPVKMVDNAAVRLVDSSDSLLVQGMQVYCDSNGANADVSCAAAIRGVFTLGSSDDVKIQYYIQSATTPTSTFGEPLNAGIEQYATMTIIELP